MQFFQFYTSASIKSFNAQSPMYTDLFALGETYVNFVTMAGVLGVFHALNFFKYVTSPRALCKCRACTLAHACAQL
ncbi:hypothetical protein EON66_12125 [archaeon]|nr:MAG: hypothetical protein EON66_12125 [archaeon]